MRKLLVRRKPVTCPAPETLVSHAFGTGEGLIAAHLDGCSACRAEVAQLRAAAGHLRSSVSLESCAETPECLDEFTLADLVDGRLDPHARQSVVGHLLVCARCRSAVRAIARVAADPGVASQAPAAAIAAAPQRWRRGAQGGLAAAAVLALLLWPSSSPDPDFRLREQTLTTTVAPEPIAPRAAVERADGFTWSSVPGAQRYHLRLYDADGTVVWRTETADTAAALPDSIELRRGARYYWSIDAQTDWLRSARSDLVEFRITRRRR